MTLSWTLGSVAAALGGDLFGDPATPVSSVGIDSRTTTPGQLFVAIRGERFDGHDFVESALGNGVAGVVVNRGATMPSGPHVVVDDTASALLTLAATRRNEITVPVVAVTGSTGKTSTKDLLAAALPDATASLRSFNNEVGVPLTVLGVPDTAHHVVLEVGSRGRGHIAWLAPAVQPDVSIITNLGVVHLETFGTVETLADSKWELVEALTDGGTAVLPVDESRLHRSHSGSTLTFGMSPSADVAVAELALDDGGLPSFVLRTPIGTAAVRLPLPGAHQSLNAAAAVAAGMAVGVDLGTMVHGLETAAGSPWRMEIHRGSFSVVNDAYNANPDSVRAALHTVAAMPGRRIAVLGRMAELGQREAEEHRRMGAEAQKLGFAAVVVVGDDPGYASGAGSIAVSATDIEHAGTIVTDLVRQGDVVLVKASRSVGLEKLAAQLIDQAGPSPDRSAASSAATPSDPPESTPTP